MSGACTAIGNIWIESVLFVAANGSEPAQKEPVLSEVDLEERNWAREIGRKPETFHQIYDRYYERILNFFFRRVRERTTAEDLTSKVFLSALEYLSTAQRDLYVRPWLYRVATNEWLSHERQRVRWGQRLTEELGRWIGWTTAPHALNQLTKQELLEKIRSVLMGLPPRYREPILLRYDDELSDADIARVLNLATGSVRSRISRGLALVRQRIGTSGFESQEEKNP